MPANRKLIRRAINNLRNDRFEHCTLELRDPNNPNAYCAEGIILHSVDPEGWILTVDKLWMHRLYYEEGPNELFAIFNDVDPFHLRPLHNPAQFNCNNDPTLEWCDCRIIFELSDDFGRDSWVIIADYLEQLFIYNSQTEQEHKT